MIDFSMQNLPYINPFTNNVLLLLSVLLVKFLFNTMISHDPLKYFHFYCTKLSNKVNKSNNSSTQQHIAGMVAIFVTLAPIVIILWLFAAFIEIKWLWQGFLLYLAIGPLGVSKAGKSVAQALVANNNYLAKQILNPWVLRETDQLSSMGLSKASIEMMLLKMLQQKVVIIMYFLLMGPLAALSIRLLFEMHYSWNIKQAKFHYFGLTISKIVNILQWLPVRLFTLILLLTLANKNIVLYWRLLKGKVFVLNNDIALHCLSLALEIKLGGVALYNGTKVRKKSFNEQAKQPSPTDIIHASNKIKQIGIILLFLLFASATLATIFQQG